MIEEAEGQGQTGKKYEGEQVVEACMELNKGEGISHHWSPKDQ